MAAFIHAWAEFVIARRAAILVATLLLLPLIILSGGTIPFDNSTQRYFLADDPALIDYDSLYENFGDNEYLLVGIEAGSGEQDIFTAETLAALAAISDFLDFHPHVTQMRSLSNYQFISGDQDALNTDYLIDDIYSLASEPAEIARVKETLADEELALGTLITQDYRHTRIAARVEYSQNSSAIKVELAQDLYTFIESELAPSDAYALHLSGYPVANEQFESLSANDTSVLIPIMIVVMVAVLYLSFRSMVATVVPWLVIAAGLLSVLEIQYYIGIPHTTIDSAALPSTLIIIGIGLSVHVLLEYFHFAIAEGTGKQAVAQAIRAIWLPAFFTAITTSAGFLALSTARLLPIREFSLLGAIGPLLLFLFALTSLPAALSYVTRLPANTKRVLQNGFLTRLTRKIPDFVRQQRIPVLAIGALLVLFSIWNLPNIRVDTNYITLFKADNPARQDIVYFDDTFRGMMTLDIVLDSGMAEGVKEPTFLEEVASIQAWLEQRPNLGPINSLPDFLKEINQALNADNKELYQLPRSREAAAQFLLLYDSAGPNEDLSDIKDFENRLTRLVIPVVNMPASEMQQELDTITAYMESNYPHLDPMLTGTMALLTAQQIYTAESMVESFLIALTVISVFFIVLFRSVKYGLMSIIPSVVPILLAASVASSMGVLFDQSAVLVFAMTMGLAVDDAIHVMSRYLVYKRDGASTHDSLQHAMGESGRAVLFSSMVLVFGFSVLTLGSFTTVVNVGLFGSIIMFLALLGDLIFLPAILYAVDGEDES